MLNMWISNSVKWKKNTIQILDKYYFENKNGQNLCLANYFNTVYLLIYLFVKCNTRDINNYLGVNKIVNMSTKAHNG